jgi:hypothetical protein
MSPFHLAFPLMVAPFETSISLYLTFFAIANSAEKNIAKKMTNKVIIKEPLVSLNL